MNIVYVTAYTAGTTCTYIAREKLIRDTRAPGYNIKVEAQDTVDTENELLIEDIAAVDVVVLIADVKIKGEK